VGSEVLVILAAGAGRRFGGGKQLSPVGPGGEVLMDYTMYWACQAGFRRVVVVTRSELDAAMREHFFSPSPSSIPSPSSVAPVELVHQPPGRAGTVPALLAARPSVGDEQFAVVNADDLYPLEALVALRRWDGPGHAVLGFHLAATLLPGVDTGPVNRALCDVAGGDDHRLVRLIETGVTRRNRRFVVGRGPEKGEYGASVALEEQLLSGEQLVSMNSWAFRPSIWDDLETEAEGEVHGDVDGELLLPTAIGALVARGATRVTVVPIEGSCVGVTWARDLETMRALVRDRVAAGQLPARIEVGP